VGSIYQGFITIGFFEHGNYKTGRLLFQNCFDGNCTYNDCVPPTVDKMASGNRREFVCIEKNIDILIIQSDFLRK